MDHQWQLNKKELLIQHRIQQHPLWRKSNWIINGSLTRKSCWFSIEFRSIHWGAKMIGSSMAIPYKRVVDSAYISESSIEEKNNWIINGNLIKKSCWFIREFHSIHYGEKNDWIINVNLIIKSCWFSRKFGGSQFGDKKLDH